MRCPQPVYNHLRLFGSALRQLVRGEKRRNTAVIGGNNAKIPPRFAESVMEKKYFLQLTPARWAASVPRRLGRLAKSRRHPVFASIGGFQPPEKVAEPTVMAKE